MSKNFRLQENLSEDEKLDLLKKKFNAKINGARFDWRFKKKVTVSELTLAITGERVNDNNVVDSFDDFLRNLFVGTTKPKQTSVVQPVSFKLNSLRNNPNVTAYAEQIAGAEESLAGIIAGHHLVEYIAATGEGKTFALGGIICELIERDFFTRPFPCSVPPVWLLTAATAIVQTERVLHGLFNIPKETLRITNYEDLRTIDACKSFMERRIDVVNGEEKENFYWRLLSWPKLLICDESQRLKNWPDSIQSKIIMNYADLTNQPRAAIFNELYDETYLIRSSATPGSRPSDFAISFVAARVEIV